jgi:hypothetical protein
MIKNTLTLWAVEKEFGVFSPNLGQESERYLNFGGLLVEKKIGTIFHLQGEDFKT